MSIPGSIVDSFSGDNWFDKKKDAPPADDVETGKSSVQDLSGSKASTDNIPEMLSDEEDTCTPNFFSLSFKALKQITLLYEKMYSITTIALWFVT